MKRWIQAGSLALKLVVLAVAVLPVIAAAGPSDGAQVMYVPGQKDTTQATSRDAGTMHVASIDMRYKRAGRSYIVYAEVAIVDETGNPVSGATVDVAFEFPTGSGAFKSATTGVDGTATVKVRAKSAGVYVSSVIEVEHAALAYAPEDNVETSETLVIP
jgi:hypothetical protein